MGLLAVIPEGSPVRIMKTHTEPFGSGFFCFQIAYESELSTLLKTKNPQLSLWVLTFAEKEGFEPPEV